MSQIDVYKNNNSGEKKHYKTAGRLVLGNSLGSTYKSIFTKEIVNKVDYYNSIYNFANSTNANERTMQIDGFRHTFMSALLCIRNTEGSSHYICDKHELENLQDGHSLDESIMDKQ